MNPLLTVEAAQSGEGFVAVVNTFGPDGLNFWGGLLGGTIETPPSPGLFLANVHLPSRGSATYRFEPAGNIETPVILMGQIGIPEPGCLVLLSIGLVSLLGASHFAERNRGLR